ncbi:MAG: Abortive infection [Planctomycetota bacterium]|nr:MAG: Abortive infection [Planctomycetota bacterium]
MLVYTVTAIVSFVAAGSLFWKRRRQVGRHVPAALTIALMIGLCQLLVILALSRVPPGKFEERFFRDMMFTQSVVFLPALFLSGFVMAATGAWLSERAKTEPYPVTRVVLKERGKSGWPILQTLGIAVIASGVAVAWSVVLFKGCEIVTGKPPQPAPGLEPLLVMFKGRFLLLLGFGIAAAIWEEVFVRLFLLNALRVLFRNAKGSTIAAVVVSSAIWAAGHAMTMNPEIVKFLQVFPIGILFAIVYIRRGAEATLASHCVFNFGILFIGGFQ